jgi:trk system potassium uptake protein TrkH
MNAAGAACLLIGLSVLAARASQAVGRWGASLGTVAAVAVAIHHAPHQPQWVLVFALAAATFLSLLWRRSSHPTKPVHAPNATSCALASVACVTASLTGGYGAVVAAASAGVALLLASGPWIREAIMARRHLWRARGLAMALLLATVAAGLAAASLLPRGALALAALAPLACFAVLVRPYLFSGSAAALLLEHPARLLVVTFVGLCVLGTFGLALPWSSSHGESIGLLDAAFTSVSATCVTGLIVLDTPVDFSLGGQIVILLLIQAGGLGIMTISTSALSLLGRRLSLRQEAVMAALVSQENRADLYRALTRTLGVTALFEIVGAVLLTLEFHRVGEAWPMAAWRGFFTSISAFCNAGFALQSDSLIPYQSRPVVLHVVGVLIIAGGLSPVAIVALPAAIRGKRIRLQVRVALLSTAALLIAGFVVVGALEWGSSMSALGWLDRIHNAWFQSVTLRTAGFNSVDFNALQPATWMVMMVFMFVGGCPGGTAGGLKTTTAFVLLLSVAGSLRGRTTANAFGRTIPVHTVFKAAAIATMGVLATVVAFTLLLIAQQLPFPVALFEVVSALGTVGLSIGGTGMLDEIGKTIIMVCMFLGRVGPLTVFLILSDRRMPSSWVLPEEEIEVG